MKLNCLVVTVACVLLQLLRGVVHANPANAPIISAATSTPSCSDFHTVKSGDTCSSIWTEHGISQNVFFKLNSGINCAKLCPGELLCVDPPPADTSTCSSLYRAKHGDTCTSISEAFNLTLPKFMFINPKINCSDIGTQQVVCISPCSKSMHFSKKKKRPVLMDYIGAMGSSIVFADVPIEEHVDHYFILSFAIDANRSGMVQNGNFTSYWSDSLTPESVSAIKSKHPNVRMLLSLAGYSLEVEGRKEPHIVQWYDPLDVDLWISNAVRSISFLVRKYHLDGIDVDYESMNPTDSRLFPFCIGEVIKTLKKMKVISIATVAPYDDSATYYRSLLHYYGDHINYINFQFYSLDIHNVTAYVKIYEDIAAKFDRKKLLVSLEVGGRTVQGDEFFKALEKLKRKHWIPGMFLWSAEASQANGFLVEKVAQCTL